MKLKMIAALALCAACGAAMALLLFTRASMRREIAALTRPVPQRAVHAGDDSSCS